MSALDILKAVKEGSFLPYHPNSLILLDAAIIDLEIPKTCKHCAKYTPWKCTDGEDLTVGDCRIDIRYGKELIDDCYEWFVPYHFGCTEYKPRN